MLGGIGTLVQDADDYDDVVLDPVEQDVVFHGSDTTTGKVLGRAAANFWKVGERRDRLQEGDLVSIALGLTPLLLGREPDVDEVVLRFGCEDDRPLTG